MKFILDCSATIAYFFKDESSRDVDHAFEALTNGAIALVPAIWPLEVINTCICAERRNRLSIEDTEEIYSILESLPIKIASHSDLRSSREIQSIARQYKLTAYDAAYLALAKRESAPLLTLDKKMKQAVTKAGLSLWTFNRV